MKCILASQMMKIAVYPRGWDVSIKLNCVPFSIEDSRTFCYITDIRVFVQLFI